MTLGTAVLILGAIFLFIRYTKRALIFSGVALALTLIVGAAVGLKELLSDRERKALCEALDLTVGPSEDVFAEFGGKADLTTDGFDLKYTNATNRKLLAIEVELTVRNKGRSTNLLESYRDRRRRYDAIVPPGESATWFVSLPNNLGPDSVLEIEARKIELEMEGGSIYCPSNRSNTTEIARASKKPAVQPSVAKASKPETSPSSSEDSRERARSPWRSLSLGMSKARVAKLLGEPDRVQESGGISTWDYTLGYVMFNGSGGVYAWSEPPQ